MNLFLLIECSYWAMLSKDDVYQFLLDNPSKVSTILDHSGVYGKFNGNNNIVIGTYEYVDKAEFISVCKHLFEENLLFKSGEMNWMIYILQSLIADFCGRNLDIIENIYISHGNMTYIQMVNKSPHKGNVEYLFNYETVRNTIHSIILNDQLQYCNNVIDSIENKISNEETKEPLSSPTPIPPTKNNKLFYSLFGIGAIILLYRSFKYY